MTDRDRILMGGKWQEGPSRFPADHGMRGCAHGSLDIDDYRPTKRQMARTFVQFIVVPAALGGLLGLAIKGVLWWLG